MKIVPSIVVILIIAGALAILLRPRPAKAEMLKAGDLAPAISADAVLAGQVSPIHLSDYHGRKVVLYFYPKDNTPGCTKEACAFRDGYTKLQAAGIFVLGCSIDSADSHRSFAQKYSLPFPLLLDPDHKIAKAYGAENGIPILGLDRRITYVIGEDGHILKVYPKVDPATHVAQIVHDLGADQPAPVPSPSASPAASPSPVPQPQHKSTRPSSGDNGAD